MSEPVDPPSAPGPLQFDRAEIPGAPAEKEVPACKFCQTSLYSYYFDINGQMACEACRYKVEEELETGPGVAGFLRACVAGFGAALAGSGIYYAVRAVTGYEIGLISIAVGLMVGAAVRWGSRRRGGWVYQSLAVFLTYMAIVSTYIPLMFQEFAKQEKGKQEAAAGATVQQAAQPGAPAEKAATGPTPTFGEAAVGILAIFAIAAALPFLAGFKNVLGLVIIAFGLWEAWKINKRPVIAIEGPLTLGAAPPAPVTEG